MGARPPSLLSSALRKLEVFHLRDELLTRGLSLDDGTLDAMAAYVSGRLDRDTVARAIGAAVARSRRCAAIGSGWS